MRTGLDISHTLADLWSPEIALAAVVLPLALSSARFHFRWSGWWVRPIARLGRNRTFAVWVSALFPLAVRAVLLPLFPVPEPRVHDEFSLLLAADTFAHGRLANPEHPFWVHFESMHILVRPAYASSFPPAFGVLMALGQVLFHHPWAGVWLAEGLMCGAICWMLQGWLPPRWALLGTLLVVLRIGVSSYWMNTYWGGAVAAAGGALVLGALPRIVHAPHWRPVVVMSAGMALLANSRPFEGAVFAFLVVLMLFGWILGASGPPRRVAMLVIVLPMALFLALTGTGIGYYFARVTGSPWRMPYVLNRSTMSMAPHFWWQLPRPEPLYNNAEMRSFYVASEMHDYLTARSSLWAHTWAALNGYWRFYLGPVLTIPLVALLVRWRDPKTFKLCLVGAAFLLALLAEVWHNRHYAAPATGLAALVVVQGMRRLQLWRWRRDRLGLHMMRLLPWACAAMLIVQIGAGALPASGAPPASWRWPLPGGVARARLLAHLEHAGEKHLVLVRYAPTHDPGDEWVYNGADIDGSPVVWARELDPDTNARLARYFHGRRVWLVQPDLPSPWVVPYREAPFRPMPFISLGAPGIDVLRFSAEVGRKILDHAGAHEGTMLACDVWNYHFTAATGVQGPDTANGCYRGSDRNLAVSFESYFTWLQRQR